MANRDLLKEAIADAKAVKETAIANAKAALEEAFDSRMKEKCYHAKFQKWTKKNLKKQTKKWKKVLKKPMTQQKKLWTWKKWKKLKKLMK
jgi:hypothetical protein